ncbi:MAG TPA: hypothetical protein VMV65_11080 [Alphaproteobacteria bacterium]|nr:hypothetical protein [Alphaproteobacteria bacterium]
MLRRLDGEEARSPAAQAHAAAVPTEQAVAAVGESSAESSLLPRDHPKWARDAVTVSQRAREIIASLRPIAVRILTFWDHRIRSAVVGARRVTIDPSGSYRID